MIVFFVVPLQTYNYTAFRYLSGFGPEVMGEQLIPESEWNKVWNSVLPRIKYLNSVGLLWVGTSEEKQKAGRYLSTVVGGVRVGEELKPGDYLKLYRKYYDKVDY